MTKREQLWRDHHREVTCQNLGISLTEYQQFLRIGLKLHRLYEDQCNGFQDYQGNWDEAASIASEKKEAVLNQKAQALAQAKKLFIFFQTDPRGATLYLDTKEIPYNDYPRANCIY